MIKYYLYIAASTIYTTPQQDTLRYLRDMYPTMSIEQAKKEDSAYFSQNAYKVGYNYADVQQCSFYRHVQVVKMLKKQEKLTSKK